jgi:hypothetical protein
MCGSADDHGHSSGLAALHQRTGGEGVRQVGHRDDAGPRGGPAYLSFEKTALPVAVERGVGVQMAYPFGSTTIVIFMPPWPAPQKWSQIVV